jgi:predicted nucleic acid-binding protein
MLYVDTSVIVKLYIKEEKSLEASNLIIENNEAIPLTSLHKLEFTNAINLKQFRAEITTDDVRLIISRFNDHESKGIFFRPLLSWADTFKYAIDLSNNHTQIMGSRSLDILHVALALSIKADRFLSFDDRQSKLASLSGLKIERV